MERPMRKIHLVVLGLIGLLAIEKSAVAQQRPYLGYVYPAGGQQGTTFQIRLGGQNVDDPQQVSVSGTGVSARIVEARRRLNNQEMQLLREQLRIIRQSQAALARPNRPAKPLDPATQQLVMKIDQRLAEFVQRPACAAIASIVIVEVTIAPDAKPGQRELTLSTLRGVSNPLVFHVGQLPETTRKPMLTASFQVLGKERLSLRKRPDDEAEKRITLPCVVNGQIASGEVNRYRFEARKGQRLVFSTEARGLIPFVADAVPGWFQPVMTLRDADGREVAYQDDYRFKPDPVILFEVPRDGEYVLSITDAIYRGREDFVYRVSIGELPFVTSIFPLGAEAATNAKVEMKGWNLQGARLTLPPRDAGAGVYAVSASRGGIVSNCVPFELGTLPERLEQEPNNGISGAQHVTLPIIINGRINRPDDWDVFQFSGQAGETVVVEVKARRLDSPLDSFIKITDARGNVIAFNDDNEDPEAGSNTHDADSYRMLKLSVTGPYYVHVGDTARLGGEEYAYRLRISSPRPDFALRIVPSSVNMRSRSSATITVNAIRKDGFNAPIQLVLKAPPAGFAATPVQLTPAQPMARLTVRTDRVSTPQPVSLCIEGRTKTQDGLVAHVAVPAEDRMQAFLWRHLVPAQELQALVFDPSSQPPTTRIPRTPRPAVTPTTLPAPAAATRPAFTKQQVASRLRQLKMLFEDGLLTDDFYHEKVRECEAAQ